MLGRPAYPTVVVTTVGRKTGRVRHVALVYHAAGDKVYVVGSNWGKDFHPAWSWNLLAFPLARLTSSAVIGTFSATLLDERRVQLLWPDLLGTMPA
jgi:deazaflavin-dependent oxidoreductase (nitroreductase family)